MPGGLEDTRQVVTFLAREISPHTVVNLMGQYHPAHQVAADSYPELNCGVCREEMQQARQFARDAGLHRWLIVGILFPRRRSGVPRNTPTSRLGLMREGPDWQEDGSDRHR